MNFITIEYDVEDYDYFFNFESDHEPFFHDKHIYLVTEMFDVSCAVITSFNPFTNFFYIYKKNPIFPLKPHVKNAFNFQHRNASENKIKQFIHKYKNYKMSNHNPYYSFVF